MKYSKKQRKGIYLEALEILANADITESELTTERQVMAQFACHAISQACGVNTDDVPHEFPEVYAFKNPEYGGGVWLREFSDPECYCESNTVTGNKFRQLVLIFAVELCDDIEFLTI
jgi:hypothetical protein